MKTRREADFEIVRLALRDYVPTAHYYGQNGAAAAFERLMNPNPEPEEKEEEA